MKTVYVSSPLEWRRRLQMILPPIPLPESRPVSETILAVRRHLQSAQQPERRRHRTGTLSGGRREK